MKQLLLLTILLTSIGTLSAMLSETIVWLKEHNATYTITRMVDPTSGKIKYQRACLRECMHRGQPATECNQIASTYDPETKTYEAVICAFGLPPFEYNNKDAKNDFNNMKQKFEEEKAKGSIK